MKTLKSGLVKLQFVLILGAWLAYIIYVLFVNGTSHTGYNVKRLSAFYASWCVVAFVLWLFRRNRLLMLSAIVAALAAINVFLFDYYGVMMNYNDWASGGLNERTVACWFVDCM